MANLKGKNIVLCYPVEPKHVDQIRETAPDSVVIDAGQEGIAQEILRADIFCGHAKVPVPWDDVVREGRLQWIQSSAAGMDHCLVPSVIASEILVTSASGLFANQVAEQSLAILLGLIRNMRTFHEAQRNKEFIRQPTDDLQGKTVGIVGFGGNGRRLAQVLAPLRVRIVATDMFPVNKPDYVHELLPADQLELLLHASDVVILCLPLNDRTQGMFDRHAFQQLKPGSYFINVARGPIVVESDLIEALESGHLAAAGLDVTEVEPPPTDSPLWEMPHVIITPHVGAQANDRVDVTTSFFCENLERYTTSRPLLNLVDKVLGFPRPTEG